MPDGWEVDNGLDPLDPDDPDDTGVPDGMAVYRKWHVKSDGNDTTGTGTRTRPLATVQKALEKMAAVYAGTWPEKGTASEAWGGIVILDEVNVGRPIAIDGSYPPVVLTGDDNNLNTGKLQAQAAIADGNEITISRPHSTNIIITDAGYALLKITGQARVALAGNLVLKGRQVGTDKIRGVYVNNSEFIIKSGEISGNTINLIRGGSSGSSGSGGGGVFLDYGSFSGSSSPKFEVTNGTIYGYTAAAAKRNTVKLNETSIDGRGHAVALGGVYDADPIFFKDTDVNDASAFYNGSKWVVNW